MDNNISHLVGINLMNPIMKVKHSDLERADNDSPHKSKCTACHHGVLLMERHIDTFKLKNTDRCILCGQSFEYTDIPDNTISHL